MELYFIRHGETDYNKEKRLQGGLDTRLNDIGKEQALKASEEIADLDIDVIISSPQKRAVDTAEIIASKIKKEIVIDENLRERSFGVLQGMLFSDIFDRHPQFFEIIKSESANHIEGIESISEIENRVFNVIDSLKKKYKSKKVLLVSHGATARIFHKVINKNENYSEVEVNNCQIEKFDI